MVGDDGRDNLNAELKFCPFCGSKALHDIDVYGIHTVFCGTNTCSAEMAGVRKKEVYDNWNKRFEPRGGC